jgi:hypothetical protein
MRARPTCIASSGQTWTDSAVRKRVILGEHMPMPLASGTTIDRDMGPRLEPEIGISVQRRRRSPSTADSDRGIAVTQSKSEHPFGNAMRAAILCIDWILRRWYGVYPYSATEDALLRIAVRASEAPITLSDGTHVMRGDMVVDLHIWNERIATLGPLGPSLAWASRVRHRIEHSLIVLAQHLESRGYLDQCAAVRAETVFVSGRGAKKLARIAEHYGLTQPVNAQPADLGHGLLAYGLAWACNPKSLAGRCFKPMRHEFWISGVAFRRYYLRDRPSVSVAAITDPNSVPGISREGYPSYVTGAATVGAADSPIALLPQARRR